MLESTNSVDYVDLGLPSGTRWAACNIGASRPNDYGLYFSSQFLDPMKSPSEGKHIIMYKPHDTHNGLSKIMAIPQEDALKQFWPQLLGIPTDQQMRELLSECIWIWTTDKNVSNTCYTVISRRNNNRIILPAAGWYADQAYQRIIKYQEYYDIGFISREELDNSLFDQEQLRHDGAHYGGRYLTRRTIQPLRCLGLAGGSPVLQFNEQNYKIEIIPDTIWMPIRPVICR